MLLEFIQQQKFFQEDNYITPAPHFKFQENN
jgi:hypothetical protein